MYTQAFMLLFVGLRLASKSLSTMSWIRYGDFVSGTTRQTTFSVPSGTRCGGLVRELANGIERSVCVRYGHTLLCCHDLVPPLLRLPVALEYIGEVRVREDGASRI
jgi:hypothetical protein